MDSSPRDCAVAVSDDDIQAVVRILATREGIFVEPSAAAPIAAIKQPVALRRLGPDERVVAVTTGHGLKDVPDAVLTEMPKPIAPDEAALTELLV